MRYLLALLLPAVAAAQAPHVPDPLLTPGERVRVEIAGKRYEGRLVEILPDSLIVADSLGSFSFAGVGQNMGLVFIKLKPWDERKRKVKVSPLARWSDEQVERYVAEHGVLVNPLAYDGYPSIGCWPCTTPIGDGEHARAGRWRGSDKTECGLHDFQ